jgi:hypothetical protein
MDYEQMGYPELQRLCRERGLPATGAGKVLVQRLTKDDEVKARSAPLPPATVHVPPMVAWEEPPIPLGEDTSAPERYGMAIQTPVLVAPTQEQFKEEGYDQHLRTYFVMYRVDSKVPPTDLAHQDFLSETSRRAIAAGCQVRGGLYAGRRTSYVEHGDALYVCYEVSARRSE